jgi:hypothetical protein
MTMDRLKTGSGKQLRTEALTATALPVPYDATAMPGAVVLGSNGRLYASAVPPGRNAYEWVSLLGQSELAALYIGEGLPSGDISGVATPKLQVEGAGSDFGGSSMALIRHVDSTAQPGIALCKTRGVTLGSRTLVQNQDRLGSISFQGADGQRFVVGAVIRGIVDGAPGLNQMPCMLDFTVTPPGTFTPTPGTDFAVLALRITSAGKVLIGNTTGTERLSVTGNIQLTGASDTLMVGANTVVGARKTGWQQPSGAATRTAFDPATVTLPQLAERVAALINDLSSHGLIGA